VQLKLDPAGINHVQRMDGITFRVDSAALGGAPGCDPAAQLLKLKLKLSLGQVDEKKGAGKHHLQMSKPC
jgi:hypothetical protein